MSQHSEAIVSAVVAAVAFAVGFAGWLTKIAVDLGQIKGHLLARVDGHERAIAAIDSRVHELETRGAH